MLSWARRQTTGLPTRCCAGTRNTYLDCPRTQRQRLDETTLQRGEVRLRRTLYQSPEQATAVDSKSSAHHEHDTSPQKALVWVGVFPQPEHSHVSSINTRPWGEAPTESPLQGTRGLSAGLGLPYSLANCHVARLEFDLLVRGQLDDVASRSRVPGRYSRSRTIQVSPRDEPDNCH